MEIKTKPLTQEEAKKQLLESCKDSIKVNGIEPSIQEIMANQFGLEQIQSDFHCLLLTLIGTLVENKVIDPAKFDADYLKNKELQQDEIKKYLATQQGD